MISVPKYFFHVQSLFTLARTFSVGHQVVQKTLIFWGLLYNLWDMKWHGMGSANGHLEPSALWSAHSQALTRPAAAFVIPMDSNWESQLLNDWTKAQGDGCHYHDWQTLNKQAFFLPTHALSGANSIEARNKDVISGLIW